jgi:gas vesicle protein
MEEKNGFGYFLLGLGLGVAAGVLLAPRSGSETRDYIKSKAGESGDYLRSRADESREYLKRRGEEIADSASDLIEKGKTAVNRRRDNLSAAVEAGKQAYRDAVASFESSPSGEGV